MALLKVLQMFLLKVLQIKLIGGKTMMIISLANDNGNGSYITVDQNAINLVSNKINVKGTTDEATKEN